MGLTLLCNVSVAYAAQPKPGCVPLQIALSRFRCTEAATALCHSGAKLQSLFSGDRKVLLDGERQARGQWTMC